MQLGMITLVNTILVYNKSKHTVVIGPTIPLLIIYPREKTYHHKKTSTECSQQLYSKSSKTGNNPNVLQWMN